MTREMIERIIAILILVVGLGFMIWDLIGMQYALMSAPFIGLLAVVVEFGEEIINKTE